MNWLNSKFPWENYRVFFNIAVFRYLVLWFTLVPLLASALSGLPAPLEITIGGHTHELALRLPFSWQLLWVSSFFFFCALLTYQLLCPTFVRKYHSYAHYCAYHHDQRWLAHEVKRLHAKNIDLSKFTKRIVTKGYAKPVSGQQPMPAENPDVQTLQTVFRYQSGGQTVDVATPVLGSGNAPLTDSDRGLFWEIFETYSHSGALARLLILVLLSLSAACFAWVLKQHISQGISYVCEWIRQIL